MIFMRLVHFTEKLAPGHVCYEGMEKLNRIRILFSCVSFICMAMLFCTEKTFGTDVLSISQLVAFNSTLISAQNKFLLGFFSPGNSNKYFLGIWFNTSPTQYVWVANREKPLNDTLGVAKIGSDGNLVIVDRAERVIWSSGVKNLSSRDMVAQILDSGNLVLRESKDVTDFIWQSFDHPSHALIPGMKIGWDSQTGLNRNLTSWKSVDDPSRGDYTFGFDLLVLPQLVIWKRDSKLYRSGPWNGRDVGAVTSQTRLPFALEYTINSNEVSYHYRVFDNSSVLVAMMSYLGTLELFQLDKTSNDWPLLLKLPLDSCGDYGFCGPNAECTLRSSQLCSCLSGYTPVNPRDWDVGYWSGGCKLENSFNCSQKEQFKEYDNVKMPDLFQFKLNNSMTLDECRSECLKNCSCVAYANSNATEDGIGCLIWYGELMDISKLSVNINQKLFLRVTAEHTVPGSNSKNKRKIVIIVAPIVSSISLLLVVSIFIKWRTSLQKGTQQQNKWEDEESLELPCFDIIIVSKATQNFADMNKIGEGGFGTVYKGKLPSGQEIAVKRLSVDSHQGLNEFMNEVMLIAKLQHRNLVRLLGCCINGQERMLLYEFMPNGSLDAYIFGNSSLPNSHLLVWRRRFAIIVGIARGLLYLHRDSRLRIIHRDLKASNVLLDSEMNPKISDFGLARTFGEDQLLVKTRRVVGTYGYMAPEYVIDGVYSMKSDVFSFGVLVLEIVCGKKNNQFRHPDHDFNLLGHAWQLFLEGRASELIDPLMEDSFQVSEVIRCIQIGLLCVQQRPEDRPAMESVILMLDSESAMLAQPKCPGYYTERNTDDQDLAMDKCFSTAYDMTNSMIHGR